MESRLPPPECLTLVKTPIVTSGCQVALRTPLQVDESFSWCPARRGVRGPDSPALGPGWLNCSSPGNRPKAGSRLRLLDTSRVRFSAISGCGGRQSRSVGAGFVFLTKSSPVLSGHVILSTPRNFSRSVFSSTERGGWTVGARGRRRVDER